MVHDCSHLDRLLDYRAYICTKGLDCQLFKRYIEVALINYNIYLCHLRIGGATKKKDLWVLNWYRNKLFIMQNFCTRTSNITNLVY